MSKEDLRKLQDRWLNHPAVKKQIDYYGMGGNIDAGCGPTYQQVKDTILPEWEFLFRALVGIER